MVDKVIFFPMPLISPLLPFSPTHSTPTISIHLRFPKHAIHPLSLLLGGVYTAPSAWTEASPHLGS